MKRALVLAVLAGCVNPEAPKDAGAPDAGADAGVPDAGVPDGGAPDSGVDAGPDAGADAGTGDAGSCPSVCDECLDGVCYVVARDAGVACPAGWPCTMSGRGLLDCSAGTDCMLSPEGRSPATCGTGDCHVVCSGFGKCGNLDCLNARTCTFDCTEDDCEQRIRCGGDSCVINCTMGNACIGGRFECSAKSCQVTCNAFGCTGTSVFCDGGFCEANGDNGAYSVDCSQACGCATDSGVPPLCPSFCDAGCAPQDSCSHCP